MFSIDQFINRKCDVPLDAKLMAIKEVYSLVEQSNVKDIDKSLKVTNKNSSINQKNNKTVLKCRNLKSNSRLKSEAKECRGVPTKGNALLNSAIYKENKSYTIKRCLHKKKTKDDELDKSHQIYSNAVVLIDKLDVVPSTVKTVEEEDSNHKNIVNKRKRPAAMLAKEKIKQIISHPKDHIDDIKIQDSASKNKYKKNSDTNSAYKCKKSEPSFLPQSNCLGKLGVNDIELKTPKCNTKTLKYLKHRKDVMEAVTAKTDGDDEYFKEHNDIYNISKLLEKGDSDDESVITFKTPTGRLQSSPNFTPRTRLLQSWSQINKVPSPTGAAICKSDKSSKQKDALQVCYNHIKRRKAKRTLQKTSDCPMVTKQTELLKLPELQHNKSLDTSMEDYFDDSR